MAVSKSNPKREQMLDAERRLRGYWNASTSFESTQFFYYGIQSEAIEAANLLADVLSTQKFSREIIEEERRLLRVELLSKSQEDGPFNAAIFCPHACVMPRSGSQKTVSSLSAEELHRFNAQCYRAKNMLVIVCGNVDSRLASDVQEQFLELPNDNLPPLSLPKSPQPNLPTIQRYNSKGKIGSCSLGFCLPTPKSCHQRAVFSFLGSALDETMNPDFLARRYRETNIYSAELIGMRVDKWHLIYSYAKLLHRDREAWIKLNLDRWKCIADNDIDEQWFLCAKKERQNTLATRYSHAWQRVGRIGAEWVAKPIRPAITVEEELEALVDVEPKDLASFVRGFYEREMSFALVSGRKRIFDRRRLERYLNHFWA